MNEARQQSAGRSPAAASAAALTEAQAGLIQGELDRILQSHAFRTSRRSREFLRHVVSETLRGHGEDLKERAIGVAVFDRPPNYDTGEDATVRVAANEVRKRLAQYSVDFPGRTVRIELPPGAYVPVFHLPASDPPGESAERLPARRFRRLWPAVILTGLLAGGSLYLILRPSPTPFDEFWAPVVSSSKPALVCMAHPALFHVSTRLQTLYRAGGFNDHPAHAKDGKSVAATLEPGDIVATDQYVGSGDAYAAALFAGLLSRLERPVQIRIGSDISFADLRASPAVLIGAYSNRWTMQSIADYRFGFGAHSVVDRAKPGKEWKLSSWTPDYRSTEDYAIVSRILRSYSGEPVVTAAGTTNVGTRAAAEFLTSPAYLNEVLRAAPSDWQSKNLQIVLHCKVIGSTPGPPTVVDMHVW